MDRFHFFLGGQDLEMVEIASLLRETTCKISDGRLSWGAAVSAYASEIEAVVAEDIIPVAVELADDMPADWMARRRLRVIDHHGTLAGRNKATSLEQVALLLGVGPEAMTRWRELVCANDRGHVPGLRRIAASLDEIRHVRAADRAAQGITVNDERTALKSIAARAVWDRLTIIESSLSNATAVSDLIQPEFGGPGADRLLVILPEKLAAYGDGAMIEALAKTMGMSWWGGELPDQGFWGVFRRDASPVDDVIALIRGVA